MGSISKTLEWATVDVAGFFLYLVSRKVPGFLRVPVEDSVVELGELTERMRDRLVYLEIADVLNDAGCVVSSVRPLAVGFKRLSCACDPQVYSVMEGIGLNAAYDSITTLDRGKDVTAIINAIYDSTTSCLQYIFSVPGYRREATTKELLRCQYNFIDRRRPF